MQMLNRIISHLPNELYLHLRRLDYKIFRKKDFNDLQQLRKFETDSGSSYKPFDDKKAIFIHIPKCAGISINKALFGNLAGGHTRLDEYLVIFGAKEIEDYFKFTFVRNPWDRVVSAFHFLKSGGTNEYDLRFSQRELTKFSNFSEFVVEWLNPESIWTRHHFKPQNFYIIDKYKKINLDYIAFFENIDKDFVHIANRLNVSEGLQKVNTSDRVDFRSYYTDQAAEVVAKIYRQDIELLGYNFDNSSLTKQIEYRDRKYLKDL
jgi:hypothetical protein